MFKANWSFIFAYCTFYKLRLLFRKSRHSGNSYNYVSGNEIPKYIYQVEFEKPGGLIMPIIVELTYDDGTKKREMFPAQIWNKDENKVLRVFSSNKEIKSIVVDPDLETADIDTSNNSWPKKSEVNLTNLKIKQVNNQNNSFN